MRCPNLTQALVAAALEAEIDALTGPRAEHFTIGRNAHGWCFWSTDDDDDGYIGPFPSPEDAERKIKAQAAKLGAPEPVITIER
jgi:hypothetical protein